MEQIADRIKLLRTRNKMTQSELAKKIGVTSVTVSKWELETAKPKSESAIRICKLFNVSIEWLNYGEEGSSLLNSNDLINIPYFSGVSAAGGGGCDIVSEHSERYFVMERDFLKTKYENIVCIKVEGDSMEPKFQDQSIVFVDLNDKSAKDGSVYIVNHEQMLRMKMLEITPNGFLLKSVNKSYSTITIDVETDSFFIVGKVVMQLAFH